MLVDLHIVSIGASSLTLLLAVCIGIMLALGSEPLHAIRWLGSFGLGTAVIVIAKLAFEIRGWCLPSFDFYSISGHAMRTAAVYPMFFGLIGSTINARFSRMGLVFGIIVSLVVGQALVIGGYHTIAETLAGMLIGFVVLFSYQHWTPRLSLGRVFLLVISLLVSVFVLRPYKEWILDDRLVWEKGIHWIGSDIRFSRRIYREPKSGLLRVQVMRLGVS